MSEKSSRGWDAESHEALLYAMIDEFTPNKQSITNISEKLKGMGHDRSFHAVKY